MILGHFFQLMASECYYWDEMNCPACQQEGSTSVALICSNGMDHCSGEMDSKQRNGNVLS